MSQYEGDESCHTNYQVVVIEECQGLLQRLVRWTDACFLGAFVNLRKETISFMASFRSHGITWPHWTDFDEILYLSFFSKTSGESSGSINMWHDVFMLPMDRTLWFNSAPVKRGWVTPTFFNVLHSTKTKRFAATSLRYSVLFKETVAAIMGEDPGEGNETFLCKQTSLALVYVKCSRPREL